MSRPRPAMERVRLAVHGVSSIPGFVPVNVAGIGGLAAGVMTLRGVFLPWIGFRLSVFGELTAGKSPNFRVGAGELELPALGRFFFVLITPGLPSIITSVLPRAEAAAIGAAGPVVALASCPHAAERVERGTAVAGGAGVGAKTQPAARALPAGAVLVPRLNPGDSNSSTVC